LKEIKNSLDLKKTNKLQIFFDKEIDQRKWGDSYRQYMKEVPRWNFIIGLWNLRRK